MHLRGSRKPLVSGLVVRVNTIGIWGVFFVIVVHLCACFVETIPEKRPKGIPPQLVWLAAGPAMPPHPLKLLEMAKSDRVNEHDVKHQIHCPRILYPTDRIDPDEGADMFGHERLCIAIEV